MSLLNVQITIPRKKEIEKRTHYNYNVTNVQITQITNLLKKLHK